jgi:hypothetical protein
MNYLDKFERKQRLAQRPARQEVEEFDETRPWLYETNDEDETDVDLITA